MCDEFFSVVGLKFGKEKQSQKISYVNFKNLYNAKIDNAGKSINGT